MHEEVILVDRWIDWIEHNQGRAAGTCRAYRRAIARLADWLRQRGLNLLAATPAALEEFAGRYLHSQGVRPISRRAPVAAIRGFYAWLSRHGVLPENPARGLPAPKIGTALPRSMPLMSAERLLMQPGIATFAGVRDTALLAVLMATGCRVSGLVNLNEEDLIWTQSPTRTERLIIRLCEKGKKERLVPVSVEAALLVRAYLGHPELAAIDRTTPAGKRVLFVNLRNRTVPAHDCYGEHRRLDRGSVRLLIRAHGERAGIAREYLHPHALRHLYGTELAEGDVDLLQRQALLGHAKPETTAVYSHLSMRKLAETAERHNPLAHMNITPARGLAARIAMRRPFNVAKPPD